MLLDIRTLYLVMFATSVVLGVIELLFQLRRPDSRGVGYWGIANLTGAAGMLLVGFRGRIDAIWSIAAANALVVAGLALAWLGMRRYAGQRMPYAESVAITAWMFLVFAIPSPISADLGHRIVTAASTAALLQAANTWTCIQVGRSERSVAAWICAVVMGACALVNGGRAIAAALHGVAEATYMTTDRVHALSMLTLVPLFSAWNMALLLMSAERGQRALAQAAQTDGLTGALNRDGFRVQAGRRLERARQAQPALRLLLIDMDHFKAINDRGGHAAGDAVLRLLAQVARTELRVTDLLGRYGGDEFAALIEAGSSHQAEAIGRRLCAAFAKAADNSVPGVHPTLSIGIAAFEPWMTLDILLSRADSALYRAKTSGRNTVATAPEPTTNNDLGGGSESGRVIALRRK